MRSIAEIEVTPTGIVLNGKPMERPTTGTYLLNDLYRHYVNDYPRFFKMDGLSKLGFLASELLLQSLNEQRFVPREDRAVILFNRNGSHDADNQYQATISEQDNYFPSPSLFVYTLPNIVTGEIAIRNQYFGETSFFVTTELQEPVMEHIVHAAFTDKYTQSVLTGWVDYLDKNHFEARMKIISKI